MPLDATPRSDLPSAEPAPVRGKKSSNRGLRSLAIWLAVFSPTLLALIYFGLLASKRYEAEAHFIVRTASKPLVGSGFASILQMTGISQSSDDVFSVQSYLGSRDVVRQLEKRLPLREIYGRGRTIDPVSRYPSIIYGSSMEDLHRYLSWMITTVYRSSTGLTTLNAQAFEPAEAKQIIENLLELSEQHVNKINQRIHDDAVRIAADEVKQTEERLISAQIGITSFRHKELMLDAASSSVIVTELIARLSAELTAAQTQIREMTMSASSNPALPGLRQRIAALEEQIALERSKIGGEAGGLATKLAAYERLVFEKEFAKNALTVAVKGLEQARLEARRQQLYLVRVVEPVEADISTKPERLRTIIAVLALNLVGGLVGWLFLAGIREHGGASEHG
jgi:capsular polysaccharide transport system permease protein